VSKAKPVISWRIVQANRDAVPFESSLKMSDKPELATNRLLFLSKTMPSGPGMPDANVAVAPLELISTMLLPFQFEANMTSARAEVLVRNPHNRGSIAKTRCTNLTAQLNRNRTRVFIGLPPLHFAVYTI
jgi:hypothetical protein